MSKERTIIYEPHPVTAERKKELIAKGYQIIDAIFAPDDYVHPEQKTDTAKKRPAAQVDKSAE